MPLGVLLVNAVTAALSGNQEVTVVSKDREFSPSDFRYPT